MNSSLKLGNRSAVIIFKENSLLLMYRRKNGKIYYTFPGGTIEANENEKDAALRELFEETTIIAKNPKLLYQLQITNIPKDINNNGIKNEFFFLCEYVSGTAYLSNSCEEYQRSDSDNYYEPIWIPVKDIKNILLYPLEIRDLLIKDIQDGFKQESKIWEIDFSKIFDS